MKREIDFNDLPLVLYKPVSDVFSVVSHGKEIYTTPYSVELFSYLRGFYTALGFPSSTVEHLLSVRAKQIGCVKQLGTLV